MQNEYTYFAIFVLVAAVLILGLWRMFRAARSTIKQLNYESRRDKRQHERIEREREIQARALRRGALRINGQPSKVQWDKKGRRAHRTYHIDESADEVFDPVTDVRGMDIRTPWGWPGAKRINGLPVRKGPRSVTTSIGTAISSFFRPKQVVDAEYLARRQQSIRSLVEDRYGRVGYRSNGHMPDIEWSTPALPKALIEEREKDQILATKPLQEVESEVRTFRGLRVVADNTQVSDTRKKASGE